MWSTFFAIRQSQGQYKSQYGFQKALMWYRRMSAVILASVRILAIAAVGDSLNEGTCRLTGSCMNGSNRTVASWKAAQRDLHN